MVKFAKYLSICVIVASSRFIGATKPIEDCDDKDTGSDYFASGSAHSSQFLMPDGSVLTNSKGSSLSSDGIQRTFHELKKEANKYVSKSSSDGLTIPLIPEIPGSNFSPFFKKNGYSAGEQSSFSSSQSGSSGSSQYYDQQQFAQVPTDSKVTTFKKHEVKKFITKSSSGSSSNPEVAGEFEVEQNQGANSNANVDTLIYKPSSAVQNGYSISHHQESGSVQVSTSSPLAGTAHQTVYYHPVPLKLYEREDSLGSQDTRVSGSSGSIPSTYTGKTIIYSSAPQGGASSSFSSNKFESYSQRHDANADVPSFLVHNKPNTFTANVLDLDNIKDVKLTKVHSIPDLIPTISEAPENHYGIESQRAYEQKETKHFAVSAAPGVSQIPYHANDGEELESQREEVDSFGNKRVILSEKVVAVPNSDGRHTRIQIKVQAPTETVGGSQTYRKETHSQSVKTFSEGSNSGAVSETDVQKSATAVPIPILLHGVPQNTGYYSAKSEAGEQFEKNVQKSGVTPIPILLHGEPQNTGYYSKSGSSSSQSFSSGSQGESSSGSLKYTGAGFDTSSLFGNSDKFSIPVQTYVSPVQTYVSPVQTYVSPQSSSKSSSSSSYHYFSSNGQAGEQLVPNSNIFANSDGSLHQSHASLLQNLGKSNIGSDTEFGSSGAGQKQTYGFSTAYSSRSSNINGKVTENREASVAVNDNGKYDSYHVKS